MKNLEEYKSMLEATLEKFGEPWKVLPLEIAIRFISDYEVVSSHTRDKMKILELTKKDERNARNL